MSLHAVVVPVVALLVLLLPGLVVGALAGLRPAMAAAVAPLLTYGMVTASATAASVASFPWEPLTLVVVTVLVSCVVVGVRLAVARTLDPRRLSFPWPVRIDRRNGLVAAGVLGGGVLSAGVLLSGFGRLTAPNQDYDYIFHANAVRLIADSGDIAPAAMRFINNWESTRFYYPNTFHGLAALVRDLTGASVFEVLNSEAMIICLVTGLGLAVLLHRLGAPLAVTASTPLLLAGFASFPYDVLWRGPLLPFAAGVAVIPALLLLVDRAVLERTPVLVLLLGLGAAGLLGLHPSAALSAALFAMVAVLLRWWRSFRTVAGDLLVLVSGGVLALLIAAPAITGAVATGAEGQAVDWPAVETAGQAAGDLLLLDHGAPGPQLWLAGLVVVGLLTVHRARYMESLLGGAALMVVLFVMAASSDSGLVQALTRPWWNDRWRFAAVAVLGLAPLAAHGLQMLAEFGERAVRRLTGDRLRRLSAGAVVAALAVVVLAVVVIGSGGLYASTNKARMAGAYDQQRTLSSTEIAAMQWLRRHSSGGTIMNDSNDGSAYLLAVAGLHPLFGHVVEPGLISSMGPTQQLLLEHFNCLDASAEVRRAIQRLHIRYVFLGSGYVRADFHRLVGLNGIEHSPSLELIHSAPGVRIYAVHLTGPVGQPVPACDLPATGRDTG